MVSLRVLYKKAARPQTAAVLLLVMFIIGGYFTLPKIVRPTQASGSVPVIQPIEQKVQGLALTVPIDCSKMACVALTFDDGPNAEVTPRVLDVLKTHNVKATFFLIGLHVSGNEELVRRIHEGGHEIGNHTWSHRKLYELSPQEIQDDVARAQMAITAAGAPPPRLFRPPYGIFDSMIRSHVPMTVVSWNVDPEDWKAKKPEQIVEHVLANAKPGAIIDLHDIYGITADALDPMITELKKNYQLVTVSEMLDLPAGQPGIFYGR